MSTDPLTFYGLLFGGIIGVLVGAIILFFFFKIFKNATMFIFNSVKSRFVRIEREVSPDE